MGLSQANDLFSIISNKKGVVSMDDFLIGLLKLTKTSKSIDMLSIDHQQQKTVAALHNLVSTHIKDSNTAKSSFEEIEKHIAELIQNMSEVAAQLHEEASQVQKSTERKIDDIDDSGENYVMRQLQTSYSFQTRLEKLEG